MEDGRIKDNQLTASSQWSDGLAPTYARLNQPAGYNGSHGAWHPAVYNTSQWIQVDLRVSKMVTGIVIQGRDNEVNEWTTKYRVQYSDDATLWILVTGVNQHNATVRLIPLDTGFTSVFKFYHSSNGPFNCNNKQHINLYMVSQNEKLCYIHLYK